MFSCGTDSSGAALQGVLFASSAIAARDWGVPIRSIATGREHALFLAGSYLFSFESVNDLTENGTVYFAGKVTSSQGGNVLKTNFLTLTTNPVAVPELGVSAVLRVFASDYGSIFQFPNGSAVALGTNADNHLGTNSGFTIGSPANLNLLASNMVNVFFSRHGANPASIFAVRFNQSCGAGLWSFTGTAPCSLCPIGSFQSASFSTFCVACPANQTTLTSGSTAVGNCTCAPGTRMYNGSCTACPQPYYQPSYGQTKCLQCPAGSISIGGTVCSRRPL